jgi:hypothetical protein
MHIFRMSKIIDSEIVNSLSEIFRCPVTKGVDISGRQPQKYLVNIGDSEKLKRIESYISPMFRIIGGRVTSNGFCMNFTSPERRQLGIRTDVPELHTVLLLNFSNCASTKLALATVKKEIECYEPTSL